MKIQRLKHHNLKTAVRKWLPPVLFLSTIMMYAGSMCHAAPNLENYIDVGIEDSGDSNNRAVRLYQDNKIASIWYVVPASPGLGRRADGSPDYGLALYRYVGRKGTSDSGDFRVRGVLTLGIERERKPGFNARIRKALRAEGISIPRIRTMPVSNTRISLMFADQEKQISFGSRWKGGALMLALDARESEILWNAAESGQIQVSVAIEEILAGVRKNDDKWEPDTAATTRVVPVEMDMTAHPGHFLRTDLGGRMKTGYTGLDVFCFDFLENLDENLYAKIVEVAIPTAGRDLVETLTFKAGGDYRRRIEFKLAKNIERPYRYRVSRIYKDGRKNTGPWREKTGEAMLDITAYKNQTHEPEPAGKNPQKPAAGSKE